MSDHIEELISAYIDDELTEGERVQVEKHLAQCPDCSAIVKDMLDIQHQVRSAFQLIEVPDDLDNKVISGLTTERAAPRSGFQFWIMAPIILVLGLVALAIMFTRTFLFDLSTIFVKIIFTLMNAIGSILGSEPLILKSVVGCALLIMIGSGISIKHLLKAKAIQGDSI